MNPLLDSNFLVKLNNDKNRTIYARIISLNQYEHPIEQLEGVVTAGSITIDGQSAVRRICSLTLSAKNLNINNVYWGLTTKVKIEIGLQNNIDKKYDDIIWFKQGVFTLTDFKTTQTVNNYTINLTGKDKMCLLNGDVSGNLPAPVRFDSYTDANEQGYIIKETDNGSYNNFIDDKAAEAILAGFQGRYGSDYQFIRGAKKILSLSYKPKENSVGSPIIRFSQTDEPVELMSLASMSSDSTYNIDLGDKDAYGFIVDNCNEGDEFTWVIEQKIPIAIIIQEMLHQFGQERYSNIIIRDIDPYALEMLDSTFDSNYYLLHDGNIYCGFISQDDLVTNYVLYNKTNDDGSNTILIDENGEISNIVFRNYVDEDDISLIEILQGSTLEDKIVDITTVIKKNEYNTQYTLQPIKKDNVAGYGMTLLVYPDELIGQPGDSITSILDKIVDMMGDYEYFYDLNGQFIFQAKPAYIKTAWNKTVYFTDDNYIDASELVNKVAYTFDDSLLTTQYQNTPNMNNIKNDYIIWGEKRNLSGSTIKFHGRYAIDNIPLEYTDFNGYTWTANREKSIIEAIVEKRKEAMKGYKHIYNYPTGYNPEIGGWWEINDWANYYSSIFGIDLSINANMMKNFHIEYEPNEKTTALQNFKKIFLGNYDTSVDTFQIRDTDVITLIFSNSNKTKLANVYSHGSCSHYYSQFMDLRLLNKGWNYGQVQSEIFGSYKIINTLDYDKKYIIGDNINVSWGYHPDFTTSFIYRPILPSDDTTYTNIESLLEVIYEDVYNEHGQLRKYALPYDVDWRHLIHIMADDWYAHHTEDDYEINLRKNNLWSKININLYPYGRTGYEQYYLDFTSIGGFWQDLYNIYAIRKEYYELHQELLSDEINNKKYEQACAIVETQDVNKFISSGEYKYWNTDVLENPEKLNFWFDFFRADEMGIGKFAVSVIGDRPKTINDSSIKTIIYRDTPDVIYCSWNEYETYAKSLALKDGYKYIIVGEDGQGHLADTIRNSFSDDELEAFPHNIKQNFVRSIRSKTVHDQADTMLYQYSYYNDNVSINSVPVYYLQPNTIISTKDELSRVTGYYVISKINISLAYNGMMSITAIKSPERIY